MHFSIGNGSSFKSATGPTNLPLNTWTHLALVHDPAADRLRLYINGVEEASLDTGNITPSSNAEPILIGDSPTYGGIDRPARRARGLRHRTLAQTEKSSNATSWARPAEQLHGPRRSSLATSPLRQAVTALRL